MAIQLGWEDLLIKDLRTEDSQRWLGKWSGLIGGRVAPVYMSKFGDWFLRHPDGSTSELSVIEGTHSMIASTPDEFMALVNAQEWQEEHLLSLLVYGLHERKTIPGQGQCYGFAPHPLLSGRIDIDQAMIMEIGAWQGICAATVALKGV
jgi:hypothetical protein